MPLEYFSVRDIISSTQLELVKMIYGVCVRVCARAFPPEQQRNRAKAKSINILPKDFDVNYLGDRRIHFGDS